MTVVTMLMLKVVGIWILKSDVAVRTGRRRETDRLYWVG
jgi:hypothetical protein